MSFFIEVLDKETSIEPIAAPDLDVKDISEKGITLIAIVPVKPECKLEGYKGLEIAKVVEPVTDEEIEKGLAGLPQI